MPYVKRHRAGEEMPRVVHLDPDPMAPRLCKALVQQPTIQAVILGGSRTGAGGMRSQTWTS